MRLTSSVLLTALALQTACSRLPEREVLATVGNEKIRASDLQKIFQQEADIYGEEILRNPDGLRTIKKRILNRLIEESLLLQEADKRGIARTAEDENGKRIRIQNLITQEIYSTIEPTIEEIKEYYRTHRNQFREPDRVHCRQITTTKREKAEMILKLLKKGENFSALAQKYSESPDRDQGGDLGLVARGEGPAVFEAACFTLNTGQTSEVVTSEYGFHIFKVIQKKPGSPAPRPLKGVSAEIVKTLKETKGEEKMTGWLDALYKATPIMVDEQALERVSLKEGPHR